MVLNLDNLDSLPLPGYGKRIQNIGTESNSTTWLPFPRGTLTRPARRR